MARTTYARTPRDKKIPVTISLSQVQIEAIEKVAPFGNRSRFIRDAVLALLAECGDSQNA